MTTALVTSDARVGLMEETRQLSAHDDVDVFPVQLLKKPLSGEALAEAIDFEVVRDVVETYLPPLAAAVRESRFGARHGDS